MNGSAAAKYILGYISDEAIDGTQTVLLAHWVCSSATSGSCSRHHRICC